MSKIFKLAGSLIMYLAVMNLMSCKETEYVLPPEVTIQIPEAGLSVALGESIDISANVKNADTGAAYQWSVNGIKVSTERVLHFEGKESGNNTVKLTVIAENGTATDAANVLVARGEIDASISVVGDRKPEIEYLDSLVLRGNVFCREDYEVEWLIDDKRVSKEHYYVFKALKEGVHKVTFKALDANGKFATNDIEIKVNVPVLDVAIDEPEYGFRTPVGTPLTLHGEANRISDVQYEWIVNGKVVGTEQDYTLPGENLDLVEVTLKVTDPTQTASTKVTVDVHNVTQYGSYIVSQKDFHFVDYAGRLTMNVYTAANPDVDVDKVSFNATSDYNDKYFVYQSASKNVISGSSRTAERTFSVIDLKTLHQLKEVKISFQGAVGTGKMAIANDNIFYAVKITDNQYKGEDLDGLYMIDPNTGEKKRIFDLEDKTTLNTIFSHNGRIFLICNGKEMSAFNGSTGALLYTKSDFYLSNMDKRETYAVGDDKLIRFQSNSSYMICYDLLTGERTMFYGEKDSSRLYARNMSIYNGYVYTCNDGFVGRIQLESEEEDRPFNYIADINSHNQATPYSDYVMNESTENFKIMPDGIILAHWRDKYFGGSVVGIYSVKDPGTILNKLETSRPNYIYQYIYRN